MSPHIICERDSQGREEEQMVSNLCSFLYTSVSGKERERERGGGGMRYGEERHFVSFALHGSNEKQEKQERKTEKSERDD